MNLSGNKAAAFRAAGRFEATQKIFLHKSKFSIDLVMSGEVESLVKCNSGEPGDWPHENLRAAER